MQTQIRIVSEPKVIESIMRPRIMEILHENISKINLGELVLNKLIVQHAFETSWHCDALTNMKITYCKIEKLDIISINKIHCRFPLQTEKTFIVDVKSVYYGDGTVEITNLKETIRAINNLFCERCGNETGHGVRSLAVRPEDAEVQEPIRPTLHGSQRLAGAQRRPGFVLADIGRVF